MEAKHKKILSLCNELVDLKNELTITGTGYNLSNFHDTLNKLQEITNDK